ncbi:sigma 54-interacting transcriptional regulator [Shinella zoogloeoides]|uniref:sigma 54-interacting transcriptional regulator n=1 Tax=Shinella zoogloeoides TaxID=352475 RepID=UPI000E655DD8|nr:sigma 54-interacting transcriptional regulator [Shinella zoogloeoides]
MKFYANDLTTSGQRRLRPSFIDEPQFGAFLEAFPDGVALLETDGTIKLVNGKLELLLNLARGDLVGSDLAKHAKTAGPLVQKLASALRQLKRTEVSGTLNSQRNVTASIGILRTPDGGAYGALLTMRETGRHSRGYERSDHFRFEAEPLPAAGGGGPVLTPRLGTIARRAATAIERGSAVLLTGETGTGKTELARFIGKAGASDAPPFVHVNCGMLSDAQFDAEMFGIEPGSSLDTSTRGKLGFVEAADGGTLFLDQVTDLSPVSQMKLVAFLESQTFSRLGSMQRRKARISLITATNADLPDLIGSGAFRRDLYYRIAVVTLELPALRDQPELVDALTENVLRRLNAGRTPTLQLSAAFSKRLSAYAFPGNVRELTNILERAAASAEDMALAEHFIVAEGASSRPTPAQPVGDGETSPQSFRDLMQAFESWVLEKSIAEHGSKRGAAKALGIDIATLVRKTKRAK